jgi:hypothetical protein
MKRSIIYAALLSLVGCLAAARSNAQQLYLFSQSSCETGGGVDCESSIDLSGGTIYGYSSTEVDYWTSDDYRAYVNGQLTDQFGVVYDNQWDEEDFIAQVQTSTSANPGMVYTEKGYHDVIAIYYYEDIEKQPDGCMPCDGCNTDCYYYVDTWWWYDPFGFGFLNPGYYGRWYDPFGYGPFNEIENDETIYLGQTSESVFVGWRITSISPNRGPVGTTVPVIIFGSAFSQSGSNNISISGYGVSARNVNFINSGLLSANFDITPDASAGNHSVRVTINGFPSNSLNFFVQVPTSLRRDSVSDIIEVFNGTVVDGLGGVRGSGKCGAYRNIVYQLMDQDNPAQPITALMELDEIFTHYSGPSSLNPGSAHFGGTQYDGRTADVVGVVGDYPDCPGIFTLSLDQDFQAVLGTRTIPLTTINSMAMSFDGQDWTITVTMTHP